MYRKILWLFIAAYIIFFSVFSVLRYRNLYANYFDLGIMHHVVYNTYKALQTGDLTRILEHTDPIGSEQLVRSAVHNDVILALFSPLYFVYASPEVLLIIQTVLLGLGAWAVYGIALHVFGNHKRRDRFALLFSIAYLLYVPLQFMNRFEFHSVALATPFLLLVFYFWLEKKYTRSLLFVILSLLTKEQVGMTTALMGVYFIFGDLKTLYFNARYDLRPTLRKLSQKSNFKHGAVIVFLSVLWVALSFFVIIPFFRGEGHFAAQRYENIDVISLLWQKSTWDYLWNLLAPLGFMSLFSPTIVMALPELAVNLLSKNQGMRMIIFHYTALITPIVFISAMYGLKKFISLHLPAVRFMPLVIAGAVLYFSLTQSPLPYSQQRDLYVFKPQKNARDSREWAFRLKDDSISVAATGNVGTFLSSRRRFYYFSKYYDLADYVIIRPSEVFQYHDKDTLIPIYEQLVRDPRYVLIDKRENFEVYKKI